MTTNEILEPVLNETGEPHWLIYKGTKKVSRANTSKKIKDVINENKPLEEKKIFELKPQGLWQCRKCAAQIISNPNAPVECYEDQGGCGRTSSFTPITKIINPDLWKLPKCKDILLKDLDMLDVYNNTVSLIKKLLILPEEILYKILTLWIISTWKTGCWDAVAFPVFRGEYNTGKSTGLDIICELGYRMIHSAGTTFPAMVRATHNYHAGLCIDDASDRLDRRTETGREMLNFIKPSYRRGSKYTVADKEDQEKMICYNNFGFKSFAGEKNFDPALLSRSIDIVMQEDIPKIPSLKYVQNELDEQQTKLLNYRYKTDNPPDLGMDFCLTGRLREIFESIIATGKHIGLNIEDIIEYAKNIKKEREEELQGTIEYDIITAIRKLSCGNTQSKITGEIDGPEYLLYKDIFEDVHPNHGDMDKEERKKKSARIGYTIKDMHLRKKRLGSGMGLILNDTKNQQRLSYLYKKYKVGDV